jgi:hypothetical protein
MERMARVVRQSGMMSVRQVRGTVLGILLCSALAGCGSVTASAPAAGPATSSAATSSAAGASAASASSASASSAAGSAASGASAAAPGCASVNQATSVTVHRTMHLVEPTRAGDLTMTQHSVTLVRALFGQFCQAVAHPDTSKGVMHCPAELGVSFSGTFYDGSQPLARFVYGATGCQVITLTAGGKTQTTMVAGSAYAAAPKLVDAMAAVLGVPPSMLVSPGQPINHGGPMKSLR